MARIFLTNLRSPHGILVAEGAPYFAAAYLHEGLRSLTFGCDFNLSMCNGSLPASLQSFTFGWNFNFTVDSKIIAAGLQSFTFGHKVTPSLESGSKSGDVGEGDPFQLERWSLDILWR